MYIKSFLYTLIYIGISFRNIFLKSIHQYRNQSKNFFINIFIKYCLQFAIAPNCLQLLFLVSVVRLEFFFLSNF